MTEYRIGGKLRDQPIFPLAGVVLPGGGEAECAECQPLPPAVASVPPEEKTPAHWAYERLILYIQKFEEGLDAEHEISMGFAGSDAGMLHIQGLGFFAPDIITFYGVDETGTKTQLVQHVSQLNVMLKAAPKLKAEPARIGFELRRKLDAEAGE